MFWPKRYNAKFILILSIASIILISGCASGGSGVAGGGVSIESFQSDLKGVDVIPGEDVRFTLIVKNSGTERANDVKASLSGLDGWQNIRWIECPDGSIGNLFPASQEFNAQGQAKTCTISARAPEHIPLSQLFTPKAAIQYTYTTTTMATVKLPPKDIFHSKLDSGQSVDSETVSKSKGPLEIDMSTHGSAAQLRVLPNKDVRFPLFITVNNLGGGFVCKDPGVDCSKSSARVKLDLKTGNSGKLRIEGCESEQEIDLFKGRTGELKCDLVAAQASQLSAEEAVSITVKSVGYGYTIEQAGQQIRVKSD